MTLLPLLAVLACSSPATPPPEPLVAPEPPPEPSPEPPPTPEPEPEHTIRLLAVGDVLPHRRVKATARAHGWAEVFAGVQPMVSAVDLAFANLESPVAPDHHKGIHGEVFNAPADLVPALGAAGFDVLSMANNHAYDQGPDGLLETFQRVRDAGLTPVGAGPDCATAQGVQVREVNGLKVGFLAVADLSNIDDNAAPDDACVFWAGPVCEGDCGPDRDAIHFALDEARLVGAVQAARPQVDLLVLSFHWGDEYRTTPLPEYPRIAATLTDAGVDVLLGHHPHVLQPVVTRPTRRGTDAVIAYSLGNFVSDMGSRFDPAVHPPTKGHTRDGLALRVDARFVGDTLQGLSAEAIPLWTQNNRLTQGTDEERVVVVPVDQLEEPLASQRRAAFEAVVHPPAD